VDVGLNYRRVWLGVAAPSASFVFEIEKSTAAVAENFIQQIEIQCSPERMVASGSREESKQVCHATK
jgi:hypothetical protein